MLTDDWLQRAQRLFYDAQHEKDPAGKQAMEYGARVIIRCRDELLAERAATGIPGAKHVTFVYEVLDEAEAAKINPLDFQHHGLRSTAFMSWDASKTVEAAQEIVCATETIRRALKVLVEA